MVKNYLKIAMRNLTRNKFFSAVNILGLAIGMACSLLIILWVQSELNVDSFHSNRQSLYGVYERVFSEGKVDVSYSGPGLLATELKRKVPEVKYASGYWAAQEILFSAGEKNINERGCFADSDFFKMFSYKLLEGSAEAALRAPDNIALSRRMANAFFGSPEAAIGKTIKYNNLKDLKVAAVFEDLPANVSERFDYALNWQYMLTSMGFFKNWINRGPSTFIQLQPNTDPLKVEAEIKNFITPYLSNYGSGFRLELGLQRFDKIYLNSAFKNGVPDGGRIEYVKLFSIIAVFILLLACINFMNLATARSIKRAKEVGVRKTVGAAKNMLVLQFIGEALLLTFLAFIVALLLVVLVLPFFNQITGKQIGLPFLSFRFWLCSTALLVVTGFVAGSYPALFLSALNPVKVLKGALKFSQAALFFRKGLVVFQFVLSIVFIVSTIVVSRQVNYVQQKNLGFDRENLVYIPIQRSEGPRFPLIRQELSSLPAIKSVSYSNQISTEISAHVYDLSWEGKNPATKVVAIHNGVGYDYLKTMNLKLLVGRDFSPEFPTDTVGYVINEAALKLTGYTNPIGKPLIYFGHKGKIIGVLKDFNFQSLHNSIQPLVIEFMGEHITWDGAYAVVRIQPGKTREALSGIQSVFKNIGPGIPFRYFFADGEYQKLYNSELVVSKLCNTFSFLAIFISCLGLLGLAVFTTAQRTKEIGIRKVIGASVSDIVMMLSAEVVKLIVIAALIAIPIAWLAMNNWLGGFAFRIQISWWNFAAAAFFVIMAALLTVSFQSVKAALMNPVKSLKTE